ncbi:hypothetical protein LTR56_022857 [Elasticomyces elasticus]|nr:hypothetical protein LTR56_022857 [Elasticomyces elasticus]KAK3657017.1 hypothetical protein LTR22_009518 [Elasticomyces elasticus]KAK4916240.1 hypothetical protein LTR49_015745 [Elasticomyces elasticus]KAK5764223.1 hypothetical protein LTS12_005674 [Elasticomyces elasticus]
MAPKKCLRCGQPHATLQNKCKGAPTWEGFPDGPAYQALGDKKECKDAIRSAEGGKLYNGQTLTKQMLEAFFCKAFDMAAPGASEQSTTMQSTTMQSTTTQDDTTQPNTTQHGTPSVPQSAADNITPAMQKLSLGVTPPWKLQFLSDTKLASSVKFEETDIDVLSNYQGNQLADKVKTSSQRGTTGKAISIITNYVSVDKVPGQLYVYDVKYVAVDDPVDGREVKRRTEKRNVFEALKALPPFSESDGIRKHWATDFNTVWSLEPLSFGNSTSPPVPKQMYPVAAVEYRKVSGRPATLDRVEFTFSGMLDFTDPSDTQSLLNPGLAPNAKGASVHIAALNGLVSKHATSALNSIIQVGPNKFFLANGFKPMAHPTYNVPAPFNAHRGYYSSIRPGSEKVLLNVSAKSGTFINLMKVSTFLAAIKHEDYKDYGDGESLLINRSVRICYDRTPLSDDFDPNHNDNRHKIISAFGELPPKEQKFWHGEEGKKVKISVRDYFVKELGSTEPSAAWNCVNVGVVPRRRLNTSTQTYEDDPATVGKEIWIPADFLELDPNQPFSRQLSPRDMEAMLSAAQHRPAQLQSLIVNEGFRVLGLNQAVQLAELGLNITPKLLEIPGRMLPPPTILFGKAATAKINAASWNLLDDKLRKDVHFVKSDDSKVTGVTHGVFVFDLFQKTIGDQAQGIEVLMTDRLRAHGVSVPAGAKTGYIHIDIDLKAQAKTDKLVATNVLIQCKAWGNPQLFLILLDDINSDNYAKMKRVFDQYLGFHSVCLTAPKCSIKDNRTKTLKYVEPTQQLLSNLALKYNLKLGGQNHRIMTVTGKALKGAFDDVLIDTMVMGADVSHAPSQMSDCPSVAAVVGSAGRDFTTFPGSMRLQASGQEEIEELKEMVAERVVAYAEARQDKQLPRHMIFYRDGVGEDQFDMASSVEIPEVKAGFALARAQLKQRGFPVHGAELMLTFIVVGKRHHTRFFCTDEKQSTMDTKNKRYNGNVQPGLIVDSVITRPPVDGRFDFFLQSHQALKGTSKSAHYIVLEKDPKSVKFTVDALQQVTHHLCYNYARATKGVSYAGPAYYADRLADRGTHYLKGYTTGRSMPQWLKTDAEKNGQKAGLKAYQKRVAEEITKLPEWNLRYNHGARKNPWHPNFDKIMFWL